MKDKLYNKLLELYKTVYNSIGINFDEVDKVDNWFMNYYIDREDEDRLVDDFLKKSRVSLWEKRAIKSSYYLGVSPKTKKSVL